MRRILLSAFAALAVAPAAEASTIVYPCGPDICAVAPDGSAKRKLTRDGDWVGRRFYENPQLAASGDLMTFGYADDIWVSDARARKRRRLPKPEGASVGRPLLRPGAREVLYFNGFSTRETIYRLCRVRVARGSAVRCGAVQQGHRAYWAWGPRGRLLSTHPDERRDLCFTSIDGTCGAMLARIKEPKTFFHSAATAPDERRVAVPVDQGDDTRIALFDARTGRFLRDVTKGRGDTDPAWSPEGRRIAFLRDGGSICTVGAGGGKVRCPGKGATEIGAPSWGG